MIGRQGLAQRLSNDVNRSMCYASTARCSMSTFIFSGNLRDSRFWPSLRIWDETTSMRRAGDWLPFRPRRRRRDQIEATGGSLISDAQGNRNARDPVVIFRAFRVIGTLDETFSAAVTRNERGYNRRRSNEQVGGGCSHPCHAGMTAA